MLMSGKQSQHPDSVSPVVRFAENLGPAKHHRVRRDKNLIILKFSVKSQRLSFGH